MKILILGGYGMLGHKLVQVLSKRFEVYTTIRSKKKYYSECLVFKKVYFLENTSVESFDSIVNAIKIVKPQFIINCIGVIKQRSAAKDPITSITINSLFPHRLLLEEQFLLYCDNSQLDEMMYIFEHYMNQIPSEKLFERVNTRPKSQKFDPPSPETIEYVKTKFSDDLKLVEYCKLKFRQTADLFYQQRNILPYEDFKSNLSL